MLIYPGYRIEEPGLLTYLVPGLGDRKEYVNQGGMLIFFRGPRDQKLVADVLYSRTLPQGNLFRG